MPGSINLIPIDPLWVIAAAMVVQSIILLVLMRVVRLQLEISRQSLAAATATELSLMGLHSLRHGTEQLWQVQNVGPNVAFDVQVQILPNDGRRHRSWIDALGPTHIDSRASALYEATGHLGDEALIKIRWTTLNNEPVEKTFAWIRDSSGEEHVSVVHHPNTNRATLK